MTIKYRLKCRLFVIFLFVETVSDWNNICESRLCTCYNMLCLLSLLLLSFGFIDFRFVYKAVKQVQLKHCPQIKHLYQYWQYGFGQYPFKEMNFIVVTLKLKIFAGSQYSSQEGGLLHQLWKVEVLVELNNLFVIFCFHSVILIVLLTTRKKSHLRGDSLL